MSGLEITDFINKKSRGFKNINLKENMSEQEIAKLLVQNPKVIKRPVTTDGKNVTLGFNKEELKVFL